jgi:hypothetical protein
VKATNLANLLAIVEPSQTDSIGGDLLLEFRTAEPSASQHARRRAARLFSSALRQFKFGSEQRGPELKADPAPVFIRLAHHNS